MSAPPKPWERAGVNNARTGSSAVSSFTPEMSGGLPETPFMSETARPMAANTSPPPLPTRPSQQRSGLGGYSGMGYGGYSGYGGLGGGMYGGGMYGGGMYGSSLGYGGYGGYGLNRFGANDGYAPNTFARQAEESSRQAFQSIESIVQAFGSVAMMLESTFSAVYNSFRAVIGVADHFSRMKTHFAQIFSALAVIRTLRWLYRKLLVMLRLRQGGLEEDLWNKAAETDMSTLLDAEGGGGSGGKASWPILLFFAVVVGGPYLIWRLLSSIAGSKDTRDWASGNADHFVAVAEFDFMSDGEEEITFRKGQKLHVAPKELQPRVRGWLLASADGKKEGLVPANYLKILGKRTGRGNPGKQPEMGASVNASPQPALQSGDTAMNKLLTEKSQDSIWKEQDSVPSLGTSELSSQWHTDASKPGQMNPSGFPYQDVFDRQGAEARQSDTDNVMNRTASDILDKSTKDTAD